MLAKNKKIINSSITSAAYSFQYFCYVDLNVYHFFSSEQENSAEMFSLCTIFILILPWLAPFLLLIAPKWKYGISVACLLNNE